MRALVTGATGFAGAHLMSALRRSEDVDAFGTSQSKPQGNRIMRVDLIDPDAVLALLKDVRPDTIYHLAAFASPALSHRQPVEAITSTLTMQINLYQACLSLGLKPRILLAGSGQIYGLPAGSLLPLAEASPLDFSSPYSVAKAAQENLASMYAKLGLESVIARPFNHIGPGQQPGYLVADLSKQIAELERAGGGTLRVGNLSSRRDFTDVRDIVRAYLLLADSGKAGQAYNVCTGESHSGQEVLEVLLGFSTAPITVEEDPDRMRPADIPDLRGDPTRIRADTGWRPQIPLEQTLADTLIYWRDQPGRSAG